MKILILGEPESEWNEQLKQAARHRGHDCHIVSLNSLTTRLGNKQFQVHSHSAEESIDLAGYDCCLVRGMPAGSLEQIIHRMDLLWSLEQQGLRLINRPKAIECAIDKFLTLSRCQAVGVPIPETRCCESLDQALEAFQELGEDVVAKPIFGAEGRGMVHLSDYETARRVYYAWQQIGAVMLQQQYITTPQADLRIMILGGNVLGAMSRRSETDFRSNCAQQGQAHPHETQPEEAELALAAGEATGVDFAGIDLIRDRNGELLLLEVNACPGWKHFRQVTNINVPDKVIGWLETSRKSLN